MWSCLGVRQYLLIRGRCLDICYVKFARSKSEGTDVIAADDSLFLLATISLSGLLLGWGWSGHDYTLSFFRFVTIMMCIVKLTFNILFFISLSTH